MALRFRALLSTALIFSMISGYVPFFTLTYAAVSTSCSIDLGSETDQFLGEDFSFQITLDNTGDSSTDTGFSPHAEIILPASVSLNSAEYSWSAATIVDTQTINGTGQFVDFYGNTQTGYETGSTYYALQYPLGSHSRDQVAAVMDIDVALDSSVTPSTALSQDIQSRCSYALGDDPLGSTPIVSSFVDLEVTPVVLIGGKELITEYGEDETATGENFPFVYEISADVANIASVSNITLTDNLDDAIQLVSIDTVDDKGAGFLITYTPEDGWPIQTSTSVPFLPTVSWPGGILEVEIQGSVTGWDTDLVIVSDDDISVSFTAFVPELDAQGSDVLPSASGGSTTIDNQITATGTYNGTAYSSDSATAILTAHGNAIQKLVTNLTDTVYSPGDTLRYSLIYQVSDYFDRENIVFEDLVGDGLTIDQASFTIAVQEEGVILPGISFSSANVAESSAITGPGSAYDFSACSNCTLAITADTTDDDDAILIPSDGQTLLTFDISGAMIEGGFDGILTGGVAGTDTVVTVSYDATINEEYIDTQALDVSIDANDSISNTVDVTSQIPVSGIFSVESSSSIVQIPPATFAKDIAGVTQGGVFTNNPVSPITVGPADTVTYSLSVDIPTGDIDGLVITDFLPIPFFDVDEFTTSSFNVLTSTNPSERYTAINGDLTSIPAAGEIGYSANSTGISGSLPIPTVTIDSANNAFSLTYSSSDTFEESPSDGSSIEILFTVTASSEPFASGLKIVNQAGFSADNSNNTPTVGSPIIEITAAAPILTLEKSVSTTSADAGDIVTFTLDIDNTELAEAYNIQVSDILPSSGAFVIPVSGANIQITDQDLNDISGETTGGFFGEIPTGGTSNGSGNTDLVIDEIISEGSVRITYDLELASDVSPTEVITNAVSLDEYFVTSTSTQNVIDTPLTDDVDVIVPNVTVQKAIISTDIASTGSSQHNSGRVDVAIGETIDYRLRVTIPEGDMMDVVLTDNVPTQFEVLSATIDNLNGFVITDGTIDITGNAVLVDFGDITSPTLTDGIQTAFIDVLVVARVNNGDINEDGDNIQNIGSITYDDPNNPGNISSAVTGSVRVDVVEPDLDITKSLNTIGDINGGDIISYIITVDHSSSSTADAHNVVIEDTLPTGLTYAGNATFTGNIPDSQDLLWNPIRFIYDTLELANNTSITFDVLVDASIESSIQINNTANVNYNTLDSALFPDSQIQTQVNNSVAFTTEKPSITKNIDRTDFVYTTDPDLVIGESIFYQIDITIPEGTTSNSVISDTVSNGLEILSGSIVSDDFGTSPVITLSDTQDSSGNIGTDWIDDTISFDLGQLVNTPGSNETNVTVEVEAIVRDITQNTASTNRFPNTATLNYGASNSITSNLVNSDLLEPSLSITKMADVLTVDSGDTVTYTVRVEHTGTSTFTAYNIDLTDILPSEVTYIGNITATANSNVPAPNFTGTIASPNFTIPSLDLGDIAEFEYEVIVDTVSAGSTATNTIEAIYTGNANADDANNNRNHGPISDTATISVDDIGIIKSIISTSDNTTNSGEHNATQNDLAPGETLIYQIDLAVPEGDTNQLRFTDTLPNTLEIIGTPIVNVNGMTTELLDINVIGNMIDIDFWDVNNPTTGGTDTDAIEVQIEARILDTNDDGDTIDNTASIIYEDIENPGNDIAPINSNTLTIDIVEPDIELSKSIVWAKKPDGTTIPIANIVTGDIAIYQITANHSGNSTSAAHDIAIDDVIDSKLRYLGNIVETMGTGLTESNSPDDVNLDFVYTDIPLGSIVQFTYEVEVTEIVSPGDIIPNTANILYDSQASSPSDEVSYSTSDTTNLTVSDLQIEKILISSSEVHTIDPELTIGENAIFQITTTFPVGATTDAVISDLLPDYLSVISANIISTGSNIATDVPVIDIINNPITIDLGDVINTGGNAQTITIEIETEVTDELMSMSGNSLTNTAIVERSNGSSLSDTDTISTIEPDLEITKTVDIGNSRIKDEIITYTFRIEHTTSSTSHAQNISISDVLNDDLIYVGDVTVILTNDDTHGVAPIIDSTSLPMLSFTFDEIQIGNISEFSFEVMIDSDTSGIQGSINNIVDMSYTSLSDKTDTSGREYTDSDDTDVDYAYYTTGGSSGSSSSNTPTETDEEVEEIEDESTDEDDSEDTTDEEIEESTPVEDEEINEDNIETEANESIVVTNSIRGLIWEDDNSNAIISTNESRMPDITVTLTGSGNDGVFGTDDDTIQTTLTDDEGIYEFNMIPEGTYKVSIEDQAGVDEYQNTTDFQGSNDATHELVVEESTNYRKANFGYVLITEDTVNEEDISVNISEDSNIIESNTASAWSTNIQEVDVKYTQNSEHIPDRWFALPSILPQTGTPKEQKGITTIYNSKLELETPEWSIEHKYMTANEAPTDISYWQNILPFDQDKNLDEYIVVPTLGIIVPVIKADESSQDYLNVVTTGAEISYNNYIQNGIMQYPGTPNLGENGNTVLFGHSSYWQADSGRYKSIFTDLPEMDTGEEVWSYKKQADGTYEQSKYIVEESYETDADDVEVLNPLAGENITLFTCTPIGTAKNRWIVQAKKKAETNTLSIEIKTQLTEVLTKWFSKNVTNYGENIAKQKAQKVADKLATLLERKMTETERKILEHIQSILEDTI